MENKDKAHTTHEKIVAKLEANLLKARALAEEMKGELDKLTQELYDSKYVAVRRLRSLNAWKAKAKQWRKIAREVTIDLGFYYGKWEEAEALAADRKKLLRRVIDWRKIDSLERWDVLWADIKEELAGD